MWQHHWLPRKHPPQVTSSPIPSMESATVAELIDNNTRQWNSDVIDGVFAEEEAALIKQIPLSRIASEDTLIWPHSQDGRYNCKSGYRFLKEETEVLPSQQPQNADSTLWKRLWSLKVPNKVKNLLWRACRNAMPTKANLVRRTIINDPLCERCRAAHETPLHALWTCKELDIVWDTHGSGPIRSQSNFQDFKHLLSTLMQQQSDVEILVPRKENTARIRKRWRPPQAEMVKINSNGTVFSGENKSGLGVVVRNSSGQVMASCSKLVNQVYDSNEVEAMAAAWALSFAPEIGINNAVLEGDSLLVMKALTDPESSMSSIDPFINDAKHFSNSFDKLLYSHVTRDCNNFAHSLARHAINIPDFLVWMEKVPPQFSQVVNYGT
ncbi:uncharacterized protein LOC112004977 [Quercus suber]|uniref:uncharacterized protein LOC112004977 n=1 Tax=Quercus suber TaxID=58331 RepID=UPI000CE24D3E|nr:uncharacterized protein LOC112004977 [Quercus suber]